jgi:maltose-binding protein MalE
VTGDPPSLPAAYTPALYAKAPYFQNVKTLNSFSQPRPVNPNYLTVSNDLQVMLSEVFANTKSPAAAISSEAAQIKSDASATPSG